MVRFFFCLIGLSIFLFNPIHEITVLKPGLTRRVDLGPGRLGPGTGSGGGKNPLGSWLG
jgi:hypothetical protein